MNKEIILILMLVGLVVLGGVQAVQINELKEDINEGSLVSGNTVKPVVSTNSQTRTNVPSMVGGC